MHLEYVRFCMNCKVRSTKSVFAIMAGKHKYNMKKKRRLVCIERRETMMDQEPCTLYLGVLAGMMSLRLYH